MKRLLLYFAVVLLIVVAATSFNRFVIDKKKTVGEVIVETSDYFKTNESEENESAQIQQKSNLDRSPANLNDAGVGAKFNGWFREEIKQMSSIHLDVNLKEAELRQAAKVFTAPQIEFLKRAVTNSSASHNERILATYLLSLGGDATFGSLSEVASRPVNGEPAEPHSIQELQNNQERAKAIIAIDAIAESDRPLSLRIDELRKIINRQDDMTVKNYAQRKQSELQSEL